MGMISDFFAGGGALSASCFINRKASAIINYLKVYKKKDNCLKPQAVVGNPYFYLSADTGTEKLTDKTTDNVYSVYDALCSEYPQWIRRESDIGVDSNGNEIRHYTVKNQCAVVNKNEVGVIPNLWTFENDCRHILINAGFHGNEKSSVWGVMLLANEIVQSNDDWARYIKCNVVLDIIPIACPWGFNNNSRFNSQGIDCCFDFADTVSFEAKSIATFVDSIKSKCFAVIDSHNNLNRDCKTCFLEQRPTDASFILQNRLCSQISAFVSDNWKLYYDSSTVLPYLHMVSGEWDVSYKSFSWYFSRLGMFGLTVETPGNISGEAICTSQVSKFTKDIIGNMVITYIGL